MGRCIKHTHTPVKYQIPGPSNIGFTCIIVSKVLLISNKVSLNTHNHATNSNFSRT